jgi:hypothetical protein
MLRILRRQSRQCPFVDFVRAECLLVLLQLETVDPRADVHALLPAVDTSTSVYHTQDYFHGRTRDHRDRPAQIVLGDPMPEMCEAAAKAAEFG